MRAKCTLDWSQSKIFLINNLPYTTLLPVIHLVGYISTRQFYVYS